jgi:putative transposase
VVDWPWSSAQVHLGRVARDGVTAAEPALTRFPDFAALLEAGEEEASMLRLRRAETIGRRLAARISSKPPRR